ncbi:MAG: type IV secretion system DNA-binding domain-containing protein [Parcubacteria group bacterium]|nr:type IV secretion system DNA-binding domain-containing protein [Parcubacteria group bacterium]
MEDRFDLAHKKFESPEEELEFLRAAVREQEAKLERLTVPLDREEVISDKLREYKELNPEGVLAAGHKMESEEVGAIVLDLAPETHDSQMEELLGILEERGIMNALSVVSEMNNPHIEDDFHRILVQYIKAVEKKDHSEKAAERLFQGLNMTLYEISLPSPTKEEEGKQKGLKELISSMEQFYAGMMSVDMNEHKHSEKNYFSLEIALPHDSDEVIFYAAVPDARKNLFEKQILAVFPNARIEENKNDYNIFNVDGVSAGATAVASKNAIFPIKTYDTFEYDPLNIILNVFSKLEKIGEGAAIQLLVSPVGNKYESPYKHALKRIRDGVAVKEAIDIPKTFLGEVWKAAEEAFFTASEKSKEKEKESGSIAAKSEEAAKHIEAKIAFPVLDANLRIVTSAPNRARAEQILEEIESAFHQFTDPQANGIVFKKAEKRGVPWLLHNFSYRIFSNELNFPFNTRELSSVLHFPVGNVKMPQLKEARAGIAPAPMNIPEEGVVLGINDYRGAKKEIHFTKEDRVRHFYVIGQTGTGKTTLLKNMIVQDIANGDGVCMIDPHGTDIEDILANIPRERVDDVIYFDPSHMARPMGLNMLEYDTRFPEQKTFVVNEMLAIFNKLFDMKVAGGPAFEQYFRNSALLVLEHPESGATLLEIGRVLGDKAFRQMKLSYCQNPIITQFWENAEKTTGDQSLANYVPYITNKFDVFISNDIMRPIIAQEHSAFNFRKVMDEKKILLVNLAKGKLGDINSSLLGLILVGKILMAALSRVDMVGSAEKPNDFYLYIDEFQNVTTDSISTILSEARKYRLSLNIAHQFIAQLQESIRDSVFGNVGSMAVFRVGTEDAEFLQKQFDPVFTQSDIIKLENRNAYMKMLINGSPGKPFNMATLPPPPGNREIVGLIKELSHLKYGRDRTEIETEILGKYKKG